MRSEIGVDGLNETKQFCKVTRSSHGIYALFYVAKSFFRIDRTFNKQTEERN